VERTRKKIVWCILFVLVVIVVAPFLETTELTVQSHNKREGLFSSHRGPSKTLASFQDPTEVSDSVSLQANPSSRRPWDDHGGQCRIRIVPLPPQYNSAVYDAYLKQVPLEKRQHGQEYYIHQAILKSSVLTEDDSEADIFFVPYYTSARDVLCNWFNPSCGFDALERNVLEAFDPWHTYGGRDFAFAVGHTLGFSDRTIIQDSIKLGNDFTCANFWNLSHVDLKRDIVIPYTVNYPDWLVDPLKRPTAHTRDIFLLFMGEIVRWRPTRYRLYEELRTHPNVSYNDMTLISTTSTEDNLSKFVRVLWRSTFCFAIEGDCPATKRTFESIVAGCIPVIMADDLLLPFEDRFDYKDFAVFFPTSTSGEVIMETLLSMPAEEVKRRQQVMEDIWPYFSAHTRQSEMPSFADAVISEMCAKGKVLKQTLRRRNRMTFDLEPRVQAIL